MREELGEPAEGAADDDDDDIMTMQVEESFVCPITTKTLEEPVRNAKCKHYYEKHAILQILNKGNPFTCTPTVTQFIFLSLINLSHFYWWQSQLSPRLPPSLPPFPHPSTPCSFLNYTFQKRVCSMRLINICDASPL